MAYTVIEHFKAGMVETHSALNLPAGSLESAADVHVTQSGEIEKRPDAHLLEIYSFSIPDYDHDFYGLVATKDHLFTFGSQTATVFQG